MKLKSLIHSLLIGTVAICGTACDDNDVVVGSVDTSRFEIPDGDVVYITDLAGRRMFSTVEFHHQAAEGLTLNTRKALTSACKVTFSYDSKILDEYNKKNGTSYAALPQAMVSFTNGGSVTLEAGSTTASAGYTLTSDGSLDPNSTYALPVKAVIEGGASLSAADASRVIFVKDLTALPDATKYVEDENGNLVPGVKIFSCMEVNDTNPLNNLSFTLKSNGKPLVDCLIMFSANINYNPETGRVYIFNNENVQALLDNRDKYLKPLQDRGIKVVLGILGNHDRSGIANLDANTAKLFAKECKNICDTYNLDGIFWDDEYSAYEYQNPPAGFVVPSREACSRLMYEVKKIQPERWNIAYVYGTTRSADDITDPETGEVVKAGEYIDYALHDYGNGYDLSDNYNGMQPWQMGMYSQEFAQGRTASLENLQNMRKDGYGAHMIFAMDPNRGNFDWSQYEGMSNCARAFYDDELVFDGVKYSKDWK